jgi:hypothetical protein
MNTAHELLKEYQIQPGHNGVLEIADATRVDLAKFLAKFCKVGAEIGVAHGKYSETLMEANPELKLFGIDPYTPYTGYKDYQLLRTFESMRADAHTRLDRFPNYEFIRKTSMEAVKDFEDGSLDFVYIDGNHAEPWVGDDIREWAKKVRKGGVVSGHDYARVRGREHEDAQRYDVIQSVDTYTQLHGIQLYIWGLNAKNGMKRDSARSWMYIK